jgi:acyl-CoA dehydrogenase
MDEPGLRAEVRDFLAGWGVIPSCDAWMRGFDRSFSSAVAARGWVGMIVPPRYGGGGRSHLERFVVTEEMLRAGAPCAAHWLADRQIVPTLLQHGSGEMRDRLLPALCRGEVAIALAISEPDAGSDVAAVSLRAERRGGDWRLNGRKVWTSHAHRADLIYVLARSGSGEDPHRGLTEFLIPADSPGIAIQPIEDLVSEEHFCEVVFDNVTVEGWRMIGEEGAAWSQIMGQLDHERSGPERILSTYPLFRALAVWSGDAAPNIRAGHSIGLLAARYETLRAMSREVAVASDAGIPPGPVTAIIKDLGSVLEQKRPSNRAGPGMPEPIWEGCSARESDIDRRLRSAAAPRRSFEPSSSAESRRR